MTKDKDFKRLVRERAQRSGESYQRSRRTLRPEAEVAIAKLDEIEDAAAPWTEEELRFAGYVTALALRVADGKAGSQGPSWTPELSELVRKQAEAADVARAPGATPTDKSRAQALQDDVDRLAEDLRKAQKRWTPDEHLSRLIDGRLRVVLIARARCRELLDLNPRDPVAREAHDKLSTIATQLLEPDAT